MSAAASTLDPIVESFLTTTTMKSILGIDQHALDQVMATAYLLYQAGRYEQVDVLCLGLVAADHTYWWSYSLHAAALRRLGRFAEAIAQLDKGLVHEPGEPKLLAMRDEIVAALASQNTRATETKSAASLGPAPTSVAPKAKTNSVAVGG
jgi:Flp pilus assembly protein TadD